jgi:hypothetical protein
MVIDAHATPSDRPVLISGCDFGGVIVRDGEGAEPGAYDFVNCDLAAADFDLSAAHPSSRFRVQRSDGSAFELLGGGGLSEIPAFAGISD